MKMDRSACRLFSADLFSLRKSYNCNTITSLSLPYHGERQSPGSGKADMRTRLLELALETLETKKADIEREIAAIQAQLKSAIPGHPVTETGLRTEAQRKRLSRAMKAAWKRRRAATTKSPVAKKGPWSDAARKAVSERMKAYWAKRRAQKKK
jgi:hypothetical protein